MQTIFDAVEGARVTLRRSHFRLVAAMELHGCVAILQGDTTEEALLTRRVFLSGDGLSDHSKDHRRDDPKAPA